jgi:hypothetical protein
MRSIARYLSRFLIHQNVVERTKGDTMKLARYLPGVLVALFLLTGLPAKAQDWSYEAVCDEVFGFNYSCYADDYIPNHAVFNYDYYSDCTFTNNIGGDYRRYHTSAHIPDYTTGWNRWTWGDRSSDFRTVEIDNGFTYQQRVNGSWQDITPCSP